MLDDTDALHTRIKICGLRGVRDLLVCQRLGVDAAGLVFYPRSPRYISVDVAVGIVAAVRPLFLTLVGLFKDARREYVCSVLEKVRLDCLQFHGSESVDYCRSFGVPYIKAVGMGGGGSLAQRDIDAFLFSAQGLLYDAHSSGEDGGGGKVFNWAEMPDKRTVPVILAGGLSPQNVQSAIAETRPYAVDVSSGVEKDIGVKDAGLIEDFVKAVRKADAALVSSRNR